MEATDRVLYSRDQIPTGEDGSAPIDVEVVEVKEIGNVKTGIETPPSVSVTDSIDSPYVIQTPAGSRPNAEDVPP